VVDVRNNGNVPDILAMSGRKAGTRLIGTCLSVHGVVTGVSTKKDAAQRIHGVQRQYIRSPGRTQAGGAGALEGIRALTLLEFWEGALYGIRERTSACVS